MLHDLDWPLVPAAMQLTTCKQLTRLSLETANNSFRRDNVSILLNNTAPDGCPPNVWQQIPAAVLCTAADNWCDWCDYEQTSPGLFRAVAGASQDMLQRQMELQQRVKSLEQQLAAVLG